MSHDSANSDPNGEETSLKEQVVAYLDGELDAEGARRIEALLSADPGMREQLVQLDQTWEVLDHLGRSQVDETFTQTTLEMVAVAAEGDLKQQKEEAPRKNRRRWLLGGAAMLAAAAAGFLLVTLVRPNPNEQLLKDLPVLEKLDQYRQSGSIEFLRLLHEADGEEKLIPETEDDD